MNLNERFKQKKAVVSFEIFPPKQTSSIDVVYDTIDALAPLRPDYISVTYGPAEVRRGPRSRSPSIIENKYHIILLPILLFHSTRERRLIPF